MRPWLVFGFVLFTTTVTNEASANFDLKTYRQLSNAASVKERLSDYVTGLGHGVFSTNTAIEAAGQKPLFCLPEDLPVDKQLIESILAQEIRNPASGKPYPDDTPIELIMVKAFVSHFPCGASA